ncbi:hypothetical protein [Citrobacter freundii]|uniref:Uncharacterized protein n=1 Tax=Citrobacter freundii TaxID=546 RepID=A0A7G2IRB3_CITFR|nr:hypothetical protein [Citrobacter freundii]
MLLSGRGMVYSGIGFFMITPQPEKNKKISFYRESMQK